MPSKANPRNHRNNPYAWDMFAAQVHHSAGRDPVPVPHRTDHHATRAWASFAALALTVSWLWALVILTGLVLAVFALPLDPPVCHLPGLVRVLPAPAAAGVLRDPHAHPVRAGVPDLVDPARPRWVNGPGCGAALASAPRTSKPTPARSPPPASPAKPASPSRRGGRSWSPSMSCAATPSPRAPSSPPAWHPPRCRRPPTPPPTPPDAA